MDIKTLELRAANKDCEDKFTDVAKTEYDGMPIFEHACNYVNNSASYKRTGRHLDILEIKDYSIIVRLTSESKLEMASKSLAGFSRELIRVDQELHPVEEERIFYSFTYNNTLFKNTSIAPDGIYLETVKRDISDVEALKLCVEIFCNGMTGSKMEAAMIATTKKDIKKLLLKYVDLKRLGSYEDKMRR